MISRRVVVLGYGSALALLALPKRAAAAGKVYRVPVDLESRRLLVTCTIEGKGPYRLGIDTGGVTSVIDLNLAKQLDLKQRGVTPLGLAGRYDRYPMFEAREVIFGNAFRQQGVLLAGVEGGGLGRGVSGMLAAGCLTTMDSELDFDIGEWRLYPEGGPARSGWVAHQDAIRPSRIGSPHLFGEVKLGSQKLRCLLDTGAPGTPMFFSKVARKAGIDIEQLNWSPATTNGREARNYRSPVSLEIGGLRIERPLIRVSDEIGNFMEDGLIGLPTIQRLNLATEVKAGRLWTKPNGRPEEPYSYNMSGLWVDRKGNELVAGRVGKGSPAERANIAPGDRLEGMAFGEMLSRLNGPVGSEVALAVERGSTRREARFVLEDYL
jgi:serine protease Do